jgi:hypothetical protein
MEPGRFQAESILTSNSLYTSTNGASYTFNVDMAAPVEYQVFAWWIEYPNRRTRVPYDIIPRQDLESWIKRHG